MIFRYWAGIKQVAEWLSYRALGLQPHESGFKPDRDVISVSSSQLIVKTPWRGVRWCHAVISPSAERAASSVLWPHPLKPLPRLRGDKKGFHREPSIRRLRKWWYPLLDTPTSSYKSWVRCCPRTSFMTTPYDRPQQAGHCPRTLSVLSHSLPYGIGSMLFQGQNYFPINFPWFEFCCYAYIGTQLNWPTALDLILYWFENLRDKVSLHCDNQLDTHSFS